MSLHPHESLQKNAAGNEAGSGPEPADARPEQPTELALAGLRRALRMRSACNKALIRASDESQLLHEICRIAVEVGGYRMAWIGYAQDDPGKSVQPVAHAGDGADYLREITLSWSEDSPAGRGPAGRTLRSGKTAFIDDLEQDAGFRPWLDAAQREGYRSLVALPLHDAHGTYGIFALYPPDTVSHVGADEVQLLEELTEDLAFGINTLRSRGEQDRIQAAVMKIAAGVSANSGKAFFEELVSNMTAALGADAGFIARIKPGATATARTEVAYVDGKLVDNFEYPLVGTPCQHLGCAINHVIPAHVDELYPCTTEVSSRPVQAYVGHRLENSAGEPIGQMFVLFNRPLQETDFITSTLQIFAARVSAEIERQAADAHIHQQASLLDKAQDAIMVRGLDNRLRYWNKGAERL
jgi:GAF domain-containing protein